MKETQLIEKLKGNNEQAFKLLYKYFPKIRSYLLKFGASKQEAEDIYHDALYILINKLNDPSFILTSSVNTFLFGICKHKYISLHREKKKNIDLDVIFSGSNKGNLEYIINKAKQFGVDDLIHYVGFVPDSQIPFLYKQSLSLVMPTYLGPTNIPPLEAFFYKSPVCYSDKPSFREQVGDAVFYMNLKDPNSLVENIITIKNNKELVDYKVQKGLEILSFWSDEDFYRSLETIFGEYQYIRDGWE